MKIRTITLGFNGSSPIDPEALMQYLEILEQARSVFEQAGYGVQTIRFATQPWGSYIDGDKDLSHMVTHFDEFCSDSDVEYINIGTTLNPDKIPDLFKVNNQSQHLFSSALCASNDVINYKACLESAKLIKQLTPLENEGFANLRFAAIFNLAPNCPFFPAAYHDGKCGLGIGTENSDLVYTCFEKTNGITTAEIDLKNCLNKEFIELEKIAEKFCKEHKIRYYGIDPSICTSIQPKESIAFAFEHLGLGKFGDPGTLAIAKIVTSAIRSLKIKTCGYKGLMLPLLEDYGLAQRNTEGQFGVYDLLAYSSVCGTGLDTIPLPGDVTTEKLNALLIDIASLSCKLHKPLSARLMPIPEKHAGDMTDFDFPYFVNSKIMNI